MAEYHSSALQDPKVLRGKHVTVVGDGASAYDLLDLCFANGASSVAWIYRSTKWMRPTRRAKYFGSSIRLLAKFQMLCVPESLVNWLLNRELRALYAKAELLEIMPDQEFDVRHNMLIPGRSEMIKHYREIERHRSEVLSLDGKNIVLSSGTRMETDVLL